MWDSLSFSCSPYDEDSNNCDQPSALVPNMNSSIANKMCCSCGGGIIQGESCENVDPDFIWENFSFDCEEYNQNPSTCPSDCFLPEENDFDSLLACISCCACDGGTDLWSDLSPACEQTETWHEN